MTATYSVIRPGVGRREPGALFGIVGRVTRPPSVQNAGGDAPVTTCCPVAGHAVRRAPGTRVRQVAIEGTGPRPVAIVAAHVGGPATFGATVRAVGLDLATGPSRRSVIGRSRGGAVTRTGPGATGGRPVASRVGRFVAVSSAPAPQKAAGAMDGAVARAPAATSEAFLGGCAGLYAASIVVRLSVMATARPRSPQG